MLGPYGPSIAPCFLLIVWFAALSLGELTGSLRKAAWISASPLMLIAGAAVLRSRWRRTHIPAWSALDYFIFASLVALIIANDGNDNSCHYSVVGTI